MVPASIVSPDLELLSSSSLLAWMTRHPLRYCSRLKEAFLERQKQGIKRSSPASCSPPSAGNLSRSPHCLHSHRRAKKDWGSGGGGGNVFRLCRSFGPARERPLFCGGQDDALLYKLDSWVRKSEIDSRVCRDS